MFWDRIAKFYDLFEKIYNGKVYKSLGNAEREQSAKQLRKNAKN